MFILLLKVALSAELMGTEKICITTSEQCDEGYTKLVYSEGDILKILPSTEILVKESIDTTIKISKVAEEDISLSIKGADSSQKIKLDFDFEIFHLTLDNIILDTKENAVVNRLSFKKNTNIINQIKAHSVQMDSITGSSATFLMMKKGEENANFLYTHDEEDSVTYFIDRLKVYLYNNLEKKITIKFKKAENKNGMQFDFMIIQHKGTLLVNGTDSVARYDMFESWLKTDGGIVNFVEHKWYDHRDFSTNPSWEFSKEDYLYFDVEGATEIHISALNVPVAINNICENPVPLNIICHKPHVGILGSLKTRANYGDKIHNGGQTGEVEFVCAKIDGDSDSLDVDENVFISAGGQKGNKDADRNLKRKENFRYNFYEFVGASGNEFTFNSKFKLGSNNNFGLWITKSAHLVIPKITFNQGFSIPEGGKITIYFRANDNKNGLRDDNAFPEGKDICDWLNTHKIIESSTPFDENIIDFRLFHKIHSELKYETKYEKIDEKYCYTFRMIELPDTLSYYALIKYTDKQNQQPSEDRFSWPRSVVQVSEGESSLIEAINNLDKIIEGVKIELDIDRQTVLNIDNIQRKLKRLIIKTTESRQLKIIYTADSIEKQDSLELYGPLELDLTEVAKDNTNSLNMQFKKVVMHECSFTEPTKQLKIIFGNFVGITEDTYKLLSQESTFADINLTFTKDFKVIEFKDDKICLNSDPTLDPPEIINIITGDKISGKISFLPNFKTMSLTLLNSKSPSKNTFESISIRDPSRDNRIDSVPPMVTFEGDLWDTTVFSSPIEIISNKEVIINNFPTKATLQNMYHQRSAKAFITTKSNVIELEGSKPYKDDHTIEIEDEKSVHFNDILFDGHWPEITVKYQSNGEKQTISADKIKITDGSTGAPNKVAINKAIEIDKKGKIVSNSLEFNDESEIIFNIGDSCLEVPYIKANIITGIPKAIHFNYIGEKTEEEINSVNIEETPIIVSDNIKKEDLEKWEKLVSENSVGENLKFTYDICLLDKSENTMSIYVSGHLKYQPPPPPPEDESSESSEESDSGDDAGEQDPNEEKPSDGKGDNQGSGGTELKGGYIALIVISCIVVVAIIVVAVYLLVFRKKSGDASNEGENTKNNDKSSSDNEGNSV